MNISISSKKYIHHLKRFIATQARFLDKVNSFDIFSDRCRCIFIALEFGAEKIRLACFVLNIPM
jgi:uncharacterized Rossmann fold enzyme